MRKMWFYFVGILFLLADVACQKGGDASLQLIIPDGNNWQVSVISGGHTQKVVFNEADSVCLFFPGVQREYVRLQMGRRQHLLYVEQGKGLTVRMGMEQGSLKLSYAGDLAEINAYLDQSGRSYLKAADFALELTDYVERLEQWKREQEQVLKQSDFDRAFMELEKKRLQYKAQLWYTYYPIEQSEAEQEMKAFLEGLHRQIVEEEVDVVIPEYLDVLRRSIFLLVKLQQRDVTPEEEILRLVQYMDKHISCNRIAEQLLAAWVFPYMAQNAWTDRSAVDAIMARRLEDAVFVSDYDSLCSRWDRLRPGQPMLEFSYEDIEGKQVSLSDLRGKYIYIDMWATWCIPCCEELPYMKQLEERFAGRNIYFVSISYDRHKKAWEKKVQKDQLKGIQLYAGKDQRLMDFVNSTAIPRFILINREGRLIQADMSRPSVSETAARIAALEGL